MTTRTAARLRLVSPPRRSSVIVDMTTDPPQPMTPVLTFDEAVAMRGAAVPHAVFVGMYTAAWARAEHCGLDIISGRLEPHCRYTPSEALCAAVTQAAGNIVGVLGFGVPLLLDERHRAFAASWPMGWQGS